MKTNEVVVQVTHLSSGLTASATMLPSEMAMKNATGETPMSTARRPRFQLTATTNTKNPPITESGIAKLNATHAAMAKAKMSRPQQLAQDRFVPPIDIHNAAASAPHSLAPSNRSSRTSRSSRSDRSQHRRAGSSTVESDIDSLQREKHNLEDQLWSLNHKMLWTEATKVKSIERANQSSRPADWLNDGYAVYMKHRFRSTSQDAYCHPSKEVYDAQVLSSKHRKIKKEFSRYGNALSHGKNTLRGNF